MTIKFKALVAAIVLISCAGCGNKFEKVLDGRMVASSISPNGKMEALYVLPELGAGLGATISQPFQVQLRSLHASNNEKLLVMGGDKTNGVRLQWRDSSLEICYAAARILRFRNQFDIYGSDHKRLEDIEIVLRKVKKLEEC